MYTFGMFIGLAYWTSEIYWAGGGLRDQLGSLQGRTPEKHGKHAFRGH